MAERYHEVFVPFTDVYEEAGSTILEELTKEDHKNLVVIPLPFINHLHSQAKNGRGGDADKFVNKIRRIQRRSERIPTEDGVALYHASEGLDIALVDKPICDKSRFSMTTLEEKISKVFKSESGRPTLLTGEADLQIKYESRGIKIEKPLFLVIGPEIAEEWIATASDELSAEIFGMGGNPMSLEIACELQGSKLYQNQFVEFIGGKNRRYAQVTGDLVWNRDGNAVTSVNSPRLELLDIPSNFELNIGKSKMKRVLGIEALDVEQYLAMQHVLLNPNIQLAFITGGAGSGKTILSYAAAADQISSYPEEEKRLRGYPNPGKNKGLYERMILLKSLSAVGGENIGFLPGAMHAKLKDHLKPYDDAHSMTTMGKSFPFLEMFLHPKFPGDFGITRTENLYFKNKGKKAYLPAHREAIELTHSGVMRGRSLKNTVLVFDEVQNYLPDVVQTITSRQDSGTKIIICGDPYGQIDNPRCTPEFNGLTHALKYFRGEPYVAAVHLHRSHRGAVARHAANWRPPQR